MHPFSAEVTFGAKSFEDYMCQFMCGEVKFKDFCKANIPKYDSTKNDSFVHWYKLFCSTCLQWGVWCPPYESAQEDSIHGKWWTWLPASVREKDAFMSGLIYTALNQDSTFPSGSREQGAVEGCPPPRRGTMLYTPCSAYIIPYSIRSSQPPVRFLDKDAPNRSAFIFADYRISWFVNASPRAHTPSPRLLISVRNLIPIGVRSFAIFANA
jgi:hypothetical protein